MEHSFFLTNNTFSLVLTDCFLDVMLNNSNTGKLIEEKSVAIPIIPIPIHTYILKLNLSHSKMDSILKLLI